MEDSGIYTYSAAATEAMAAAMMTAKNCILVVWEVFWIGFEELIYGKW